MSFRVALTADFYNEDGSSKFDDLGLGVFDHAEHIEVTQFDEHRPEITADQLSGVGGVIVLTPQVTADSLSASEQLLAVGRFGVGYDSVDVEACTENDVLVMITAGAVDRAVHLLRSTHATPSRPSAPARVICMSTPSRTTSSAPATSSTPGAGRTR